MVDGLQFLLALVRKTTLLGSRPAYRRRWRAGVSVATTFLLAVTLLTPGAAAAAPSRDSFPEPPTSPPVEGALAGPEEPDLAVAGDASEVVEPLEPNQYNVKLDDGTEPQPVGSTGMTVQPFDAESGGDLQIEVLDEARRRALGDVDVALELTPSGLGENVSLTIPDTVLDGVFGSDYANRVRWDVAPADDSRNSRVAAVTESGASADQTRMTVPSNERMLVMATSTATASDGAGSFAATSLKPSSAWDVSAQTGAFAWSYPIPLGPAPAGDSPSLSIEYNSQAVDGATSSTNNQTSAAGEGWGLSGSGFIERRYVTCAQEQSPGTPVAGSADLCWATDNATLSFGGRSGALVRDTATGAWKLSNDDNSRVEKLIGGAQGCASNGTYNSECWRLTTTDGTQYYFGLNRLPGWSSGAETTNSAWTVPVFGNDVGDPCNAASFSASVCQQGWRWNLDYVVDVHGNARSYFYAAETNRYRVNNSTPTSYVRGGQLLRMDYGLRSSALFANGAATNRVLFGYDAKGRCNPANAGACSNVALGGDTSTPTSPSVYPDVPFDLNCVTGACDGQLSPSFWTTARLSTITTQAFVNGQYLTADQYTLTHSFPDPGDGQSAALWLESVQRTATAGATSITESATTFAKTPLQNRVWVRNGLAPLDKFRVASVALPTGARISVNYATAECTPEMASQILAAPWANDKRCFPQWWTPNLTIPTGGSLDLFHKYVVASTIEDPYTGGGGSQPTRTEYVYTGTPAWRYVDDRFAPADKRTWADYAGYDKVEVRVGDPSTPSTRETTQYVFYRGLHGDRANANGGTKSVNVTGTNVPDERWFGGLTRSVKTLNGVDGAVVTETTTTPWASAMTSSNGVQNARVVGTAREDVTVPISGGGTRTTSHINTMDARGYVIKTSVEGGSQDQATCTTTSYAADNSSVWLLGLPATVTEYAGSCGSLATDPSPDIVLSHRQFAYDGAAVGAAPAKGLVTSNWEARGFSGATLSTAQWVRTSLASYDGMGRVTSNTDAGNRAVNTTYAPSATSTVGAGPLKTTTVSNPLGWTIATTVDPYRGQPVAVVDENNKTTSTEYDALGRLINGWGTDRPRATNPNSPSMKFEYGVRSDSPSWVKTTALVASGSTETFTLFDGLGREVQTQAPVVGGGAVIRDSEYDSAGRKWATNESYWAPSVTPGATLFVPAALNQIATRTETLFDGAGRETANLIRSFGAEIRRTSTTFRGSDRVDVVPPQGGIATSTYLDAWGRTSAFTQWMGQIDGAGVESVSLQYQYNGRGQMTRMTDDDANVWSWVFDHRGLQISSTDPDAGAKNIAYDDLGNVLTATDPRGTVAFTYDALNRKTTERTNGVTGPIQASWTFDTLAKGQLTSASRFNGGLEYKKQVTGYDNGYRATGARVTIPTGAPAFAGMSYTTSTYYNQDGSTAATVLPAAGGLPAEELYPSYDILGRETGLGGAASYASGASYLASGEIGQIVRPGTTWSALTFGYDPGTKQLLSLEETARRGTTFTREALREYGRNPGGLITRVSTTSDTHSADVQCFSYDGLQAMTDAWTPASGSCASGPTATRGGPAPYRMNFTVDPDTGNRTSTTTWAGTTPTVSTYSYAGAGAARPHALQQISRKTGTGTPQVTSYSHDAAGAMTNRGSQSLAYDEGGRLSTVTSGSVTERSIYDADGALLMRYGGPDGASLFLESTTLRNVSGTVTGIRSYSLAGVTIAERVSGSAGGLWWLSPDPVGTVGLQINVANGAVTRRWLDPFGSSRGGTSTWSSPMGYLNAPTSATGLTQLGARAYDPATGRFISVDPILDTGEPRHVNAYAYGFNSPVSYSDPSGLLNRQDGVRMLRRPPSSRRMGGSAPAAAGNAARKLADAPRPGKPRSVSVKASSTGGSPVASKVSNSKPYCSEITLATTASVGCQMDFRAETMAWKAADLAMMFVPAGKILSAALRASALARQSASKVIRTVAKLPEAPRLPQDVRVNPIPPPPRSTGTVGRPSHNAAIREIVDGLPADASDIRVNQQQVNALGERVGINRPDLQYTVDGKRYYVEIEGPRNPRGEQHEIRIKANDPLGETETKLVK